MELSERFCGRHPPHQFLSLRFRVSMSRGFKYFRADYESPTLAALVRRCSQFLENRTRHEGCMATALSKTQINARRFAYAPSPRTRPGLALAALFVSLMWLLTGASKPGGPESPTMVD